MRKSLRFLFLIMALFTGLQLSAQNEYEYYDRIPTFNVTTHEWQYDTDSHPAWITTVDSGEWTIDPNNPAAAVGPDGQFRFGSSSYTDGHANSANAPWGTVSSPNFDVDKSLTLDLYFTQSNNAGQKNEPEIIFEMSYKDKDGVEKTATVTIKLFLKKEEWTITPEWAKTAVTPDHTSGTGKYLFTVPFPNDYYSDGHVKMSLRATGGLEVGAGSEGTYNTIDVYGDNLVLRDDWDNSERLKRNAGKKMRKVTIVRSYTKGWYTLSLPFKLTMKQFQRRYMASFKKNQADNYDWTDGSCAEIWEYTGFSNNIMQFTKSYGDTGDKEYVLNAAVPYLIYIPESIADSLYDYTNPQYEEEGGQDVHPGDKVMVFTNITLADEATLMGTNGANVVQIEPGYKFVSNLSKTNLADENANVMADCQVYYLHTDPEGENPKLYKPNDTSTNIKGFRAYFTSPKEGSGTNPSALSFDNSMTSIGAVELPSLVDGRVYNLQGQLVNKALNELPRGIYIVNHKKYVVK